VGVLVTLQKIAGVNEWWGEKGDWNIEETRTIDNIVI